MQNILEFEEFLYDEECNERFMNIFSKEDPMFTKKFLSTLSSVKKIFSTKLKKFKLKFNVVDSPSITKCEKDKDCNFSDVKGKEIVSTIIGKDLKGEPRFEIKIKAHNITDEFSGKVKPRVIFYSVKDLESGKTFGIDREGSFSLYIQDSVLAA